MSASNSPFEGAYRKKVGQDYVDFYIKAGYPAAMAQAMLGATVEFRVLHQGKTFVVKYECKEVPALNSVDILSTERENETASAVFGGGKTKAKVTVELTGDNSLIARCQTESFGLIEYVETYTDAGCTSTMKMSGEEMTDLWPRVPVVTGRFEYDSGENLSAYVEAVGQPAELLEVLKSSKVNFVQEGDRYVVTDYLGGAKAVNSFRLNEQWTYSFPGYDEWQRKSVTVASPGGFTYTGIDKDGSVEVTECTYDNQGMAMGITHLKSGVTAKMVMKRYSNIYGTWEVTNAVNMQPFLEHLGVASDLAKKLSNDRGAILTIDSLDSGRRVHYKYDSKAMPMNATFAWGEEYDYEQAGVPDKYRVLEVLDGDVHTIYSRGPNHTMVTKVYYSDDFAVQYNWVEGNEGMTATTVFKRIK